MSELRKLEPLLERIEQASSRERHVSIGTVVRAVGARSFGPLLVVAGLIAVSPLASIPTVPTLAGLLVVAVSVQLLMGRERVWLPRWILRRSVRRRRARKGLSVLRRPARVVDRAVRTRLPFLAAGIARHAIAAVCCVIGLTMPVMELVPLSVHLAGGAVSAFGLALLARDGVLAAAALIATGGTLGLLGRQVLQLL